MWKYHNQRPDELYHYGKLGMKWGVRRDSISTMTRSEKKAVKANYKSQTKEQRRTNLVKSDVKLLSDFNSLRGKKTDGLDKLDSPLSKGERNSLQLKTDRLKKLKTLSNMEQTRLDATEVAYGKAQANRLLDTMGKGNVSFKDAQRKANNEDIANLIAALL